MSDEPNSQELEQRFKHMKVLDVLLCNRPRIAHARDLLLLYCHRCQGRLEE